MNKKQSEVSLGTMMRSYGYFAHKWRDRGFISCPTCHRVITTCPICKGSLLLPKAQTYPDFLVALQWSYVECKQGEESWSIDDISPNQEQVLNGNSGFSWIFLEMGTGRAPKGKRAFLILWDAFKQARKELLEKDIHSIRFEESEKSRVPIASDLFEQFELVWQTSVGWQIPVYHVWWKCNGKEDA